MENLFLEMIEYTNQAMMYELFTDPSFGLVSPYTKGSHKDMDHFTFIDSISVLNKYMYKFAKLGYVSGSISSLYNEAVKLGILCEKEMFDKTKGINTHKGLIFVLGTLVCSYTKLIYDHQNFKNFFNYCSQLISKKQYELDSLKVGNTNGEKIYLKYKIAGVRKEAYLGFPLIQRALGYFDLNDQTSLVKTLVFLMSECDDTTIINRVGMDGLEYVKEQMKELLNKGFDIKALKIIESEFINRGISPGGSADLLCGTIFVSLIKNNDRRVRK
ncbi:MAG: citXG [Haloplasmataceae bacterium]|jgi:triphosphoribosyl-dephospho-CoA synthase|nr:citXG [Haloplasmataceae bacterium]